MIVDARRDAVVNKAMLAHSSAALDSFLLRYTVST